jgi:hypothetical protein
MVEAPIRRLTNSNVTVEETPSLTQELLRQLEETTSRVFCRNCSARDHTRFSEFKLLNTEVSQNCPEFRRHCELRVELWRTQHTTGFTRVQQ